MRTPLIRLAVTTGLILLAWFRLSGAEPAAPVSGETNQAHTTFSKVEAEYFLKARFLSSLPDYLLWPASGGQSNRQLVIGVIGESPFENYLNELFSKGDPKAQRSRLVYLKNYRMLESCDIIFICQSESEQLYEILRRVKERPILTVGDSPDFARRGVMINLVVEQNKIGLEVNPPALRLSGLGVNAQFLKIARIIE